jgi:acyl-CoA synthetase (AMP-forming)/AMP-acid ligase II
MQVAPTEIEDTMLAEPNKLISDVTVAGVSGGRTDDELVPRAWIVLNEAGKLRGAQETIKLLDAYVRQNLSRYKHLRGGIEVIDAIPKSPTGKVHYASLRDVSIAQHSHRSCVDNLKNNTSLAKRSKPNYKIRSATKL